MKSSYDRYNKLRMNGKIKKMPFVKISPKTTDKIEVFYEGTTRLDVLSGKYYCGNGDYGWLIQMANPKLPSYEFLIETGTKIRIPYPLEVSIQQYIDGLIIYDSIYGL